MRETTYAKGLEDVIAAESEICQVDGAAGKLYYRGYSIEDLAKHSSFEETTYLLLNEKLPSPQEIEDFRRRMRESRPLPPPVQAKTRPMPPKYRPPSAEGGIPTARTHPSARTRSRSSLPQAGR